MKELTEAQYEQIGRKSCKVVYADGPESVKWYVASGRAAYAASFPYAVAEALEEPSNEELVSPYSWHEGNKSSVRSIFAKRLARLAAKADPAVEAVKAWITSEKRPGNDMEFAALIVAAVRSADGAK